MPREKYTVCSYLNSSIERKRLIIGCGQTPEDVMMGAMPGIPCSLGRNHSDDFTIDISPAATPDLVMDLVTYRGSNLGITGQHRFDDVDFEYLNCGPKSRFKDEHIKLWINAANDLVKPNGSIRFFNHYLPYLMVAQQQLRGLGYRTTEHIIPSDGSENNRYGHRYILAKT